MDFDKLQKKAEKKSKKGKLAPIHYEDSTRLTSLKVQFENDNKLIDKNNLNFNAMEGLVAIKQEAISKIDYF